MRLICAVLPLLALAGCSSFPADPEHVSQVPGERLLAYQQAVADSGELVVERDLGMLGGGCYVAVLVDRKVAARIGIGERARFQVPAGTRVLGIGIDEQDDTLCGKGRLRRELAVPVSPGQRQHFRIVSEAKSGFDIRPVAP
ncbi:3-isopropylmalate dehydratase [Pseudomonas benzenivorans]|uniref:3-isopropylmalate dehydratase n=1 Tax=Pseudomonas benzenivorans TaxID=556533 RepID=A0ABZ0PT40_9PSED|nr:3-isopropylmalate dehydratase [Pseudomonas benzenivorans]WPC03956.1 3-isopropylmalate dehydratase [Pseudomonas benzenivorans]